MAKAKPYRAKTLSGAQTYVRNLKRQLEHVTRLFEDAHDDRVAVAKLSADGPCFNNPLEAAAAKVRRDKILRDWCRLNPDGTPKR